jgi:hypothetical protein
LDTPEGVSKDERADILPQAEYIPDPRDHKDDFPPSMSGVKKFFLVLLGLVVCVATRGGGDDDDKRIVGRGFTELCAIWRDVLGRSDDCHDFIEEEMRRGKYFRQFRKVWRKKI